MKKSVLLSVTLVVFLVSNLFAQETPEREFAVSLSEASITLEAGKTQTIDITLNRSKAFRKADVKLFIDNKLPEGVTIAFTDGANPLTERVMTITSEESIGNFSKTIIVKAKGRRITKGIMFGISNSDESLTSK